MYSNDDPIAELAERPITDAELDLFAMALPATFMTEQWMGSHVYKVGDPDTFKMFAVLNPGKQQVTVKLPSPETVSMLLIAGVAHRHTHMPRGDWLVLRLDRLERDDVEERLQASHAIVSRSLTKAARQKFDLD